MKTQPTFIPGDRAWCCDDSGSMGELKAGQVYYVFGVVNGDTAQVLYLSADSSPKHTFVSDRFDRMRPAHMTK